jgi:uridylate kinase
VTRVGGVYDKDPKIFQDAKMLYKLGYDEAERKRVFDKVSVVIAKENRLPFIVTNLQELEKYICNEDASNCSVIGITAL